MLACSWSFYHGKLTRDDITDDLEAKQVFHQELIGTWKLKHVEGLERDKRGDRVWKRYRYTDTDNNTLTFYKDGRYQQRIADRTITSKYDLFYFKDHNYNYFGPGIETLTYLQINEDTLQIKQQGSSLTLYYLEDKIFIYKKVVAHKE